MIPGWAIAGWRSLEARWAHNPQAAGSNPVPATGSRQARQGGRTPEAETGTGLTAKGSGPARQAGCRGFDSLQLHQLAKIVARRCKGWVPRASPISLRA